jgi:hypothetical protein
MGLGALYDLECVLDQINQVSTMRVELSILLPGIGLES